MTRWARANNVHKHKPAEATPWSRLKAQRGGGGGGDRSEGASGSRPGPQRDHLRGTQASGVKKPNKKKKDYDNEDVNGFLEFLQQSGQAPPRGGGRKEEEREIREEVETALRKDRRREDRRVKRQKNKKNNMVRDEAE